MSIYIDKMLSLITDNFEDAVHQLKNDDQVGNLEATYLLGKINYDGCYSPKNFQKATAFWEKGAEQKNLDCLRSLGDCYFLGAGYEEDNDKALKFYCEVLERNPNDYQALCKVALMYEKGIGVKQDISKALDLLKDAWKMGSARAATEIGLLYRDYMDATEQNIKESTKWYQRGADGGDPKGCWQMGVLYHWGEHGMFESQKMAYRYFVKGKERSEALSLLITSAGCGIATSNELTELWEEALRRAGYGDYKLQGAIAEAYASGIGVPADKERACQWYLKAVENGNLFAEYQMGMKYYCGSDEFEKDPKKAYKHLLHAAESNLDVAMKPLADLLNSTPIPDLRDEERKEKTIYWYKKAEKNNDEWAAVALGQKYEYGYGPIQKDIEKAIHYYQIAADHDIYFAYLSLGKLYLLSGKTANYQLAYRYLMLAQKTLTLDYQIAEIELCLGRMYKEGLGIAKNIEEAYKHFTLSASKGHNEAIEELVHFKKGIFGWKVT